MLDRERLDRIVAFYRREVDAGRLPGWSVVIADATGPLYADSGGWQDAAAEIPITEQTISRSFSLTKPITTVAALSHYEQGAFDLRTPVAEFIPEFAETPVSLGAHGETRLVPQTTPMTVWHLLSHTAGLTYGFFADDPVAGEYRAAGLGDTHGDRDLAATCVELAALPLLFQPGSAWNYSMATDVMGRVLEVITGRTLDRVLAETVLDPLGMSDTSFRVPTSEQHRVAPLYEPDPAGGLRTAAWAPVEQAHRPPTMLSGGGGLWSTSRDLQRFVRLLADGGRHAGGQMLSPRTLRYATSNHLPGHSDLARCAVNPLEWDMSGLGFGLGFAVVCDPPARRVLCRPGTYWWNGAGGSTFFVEPATGISALLCTSIRAADNHRLEAALHQLVGQADLS